MVRSTPSENSGQLSAAQTSLFQQELERAEEEAGQLRSKVSQLEKTVQDTKNDAAREIQKLQTQVSVLSEQNLQLQKSEQLCQTYKKQLQELQSGHLDAGEYQTKLVSLEAELRGKAELENRLTTYLEENKRLQSEMAFKSGMQYKGRVQSFKLRQAQPSFFGEENTYKKFFRERCQTCGSRLICNGCSNCGLCA